MKSLEERVKEELTAVDMDEQYKELLDGTYSFESVGGIFAGMSPARVLEEVDPTAFRCGFNDFVDCESCDGIYEEIDGEFYLAAEVQEIRDEMEETAATDTEKRTLTGG